MRTLDLTPMHRFTIGFDRMQRQLDQFTHTDEAQATYPPYNIEVLGDDAYRITMAVAGFSETDLDITVENTRLTVTGRIDNGDSGDKGEAGENEPQFLHHGIAARAFERQFELADHIKISAAKLDNGLLHIELEREVPEALKPRKIDITTQDATALEHKAA